MPAALIDELELAVRRRVAQRLPGDRRAAGIGLGLELAQLRPYEVGDDVRHIDPAATARSGGVPHVRLQVPERSLSSWIVIDLSASMSFGTARRLKADVAEGTALAFARIAVRRAGSVGLVAFGAGAPWVLPPHGARRGVVAIRRALGAGVAPDRAVRRDRRGALESPGESEGLAGALIRAGRLARQPGLVVVISDFREQRGWERALGSLRVRHAVIAVEVLDPGELELPALGRLVVVDPETGVRLRIDSSSARLRRRFAELERERRERLAGELRRLRVDHIALSGAEDWLRALGRALR
jgi:uncharacterized protein (DUF58 family)